MAQGNRRRGRAARSRLQRLLGIGRQSAAEQFGKPLWVEQLEERRMLAVFTVTNLNDLVFQGGEWVVAAGSLRAAINASNDNDEGDLIVFSENLSGTIFMSNREDGGQFTIEGSLDISGPGARKIAISGPGNRRVFQIEADEEDPFSVSISGLTMTNGTAPGGTGENAGQGGAILNLGNLNLTEVVISNSSATYGGGILNAGNLSVDRSLFLNNFAGADGGGIHNGLPVDDEGGGGTEEGPRPSTTIVNSTITGNQANSGSGYGGGLFNRDGNLNVLHCTIVNNRAYLGSGIGSWGNALPEEEEGEPGPTPEPTIFTTVSGTVLFKNNNNQDSPGDIDVVGKGEAPEPEEGMPPAEAPDLNPSINIKFEDDAIVVGGDVGGNNLIHTPGKQVKESDGDIAAGTDPLFISTMTGNPILADYGGSTNTFHPFYDETGAGPNSPLIDHYEGGSGSYDVRGRHFERVYDFDPERRNPGPGEPGPRIDIGAVEVQHATFVVDTIADEADDLQYNGGTSVESVGDFVIREALLFSRKNPLVDTIVFDLAGQPDPTPSPALTFLITQRDGQNKLVPLTVDHSVNIQGPTNYRLEFDGNNPPTPVDGDGTRIFNITNNNAASAVDVAISSLILLGGDANGSGGAILNRENLTLTNMTLRGNRATLDGGGIHHDLGTLAIVSSTISGNNSSDDGAVYIAQSSGPVLISNSTISGNVASDRGGALFNRGTDTRVEFSTITNNTAGSTIGSGVTNFAGTLTVYSSIISGNVVNDFANQAFSGVNPTTVSEGYNLIGTVLGPTSSGSVNFSPALGDIFSVNPGLAPLAFAGGLTQTHALLDTSPALNRGPMTPTNAPLNDQRGNPFDRIFDGKEDGVDENRIDIGAYELQGRVYRVDNAGDASDGNYGAGQLTLREAIELSNFGPLFDVIEFDDMLLPSNPTISPSGALPITDDVLIQWQGSTPLTLQGSGTVFAINDGDTGNLIDVEIKGGDRGINEFVFRGRSITSTENLVLAVVDILGNSTSAVTHSTGELQIFNSIMSGNISSVSGGAINAQNASRVLIYDSSLTGNSTAFTGGHGGGIYLKNTPIDGTLVVIANNVTASGASDGAGIYVDNSGLPVGADNTVRFRNSVISGNSTVGANSDGGGIFARGANVYLSEYTTLALNTTFGTNSRGGAVYINGNGVLNISDNVTLTFNRTIGQFSHGGAIANVGGTVNIEGTDVSNNSTGGADAHGGAIYVENGSLTIVDSALFENRTTGLRSDGGAIFSNTSLTGTKTTILNSTISGNSTSDRGGGIYNADGLTVIKHSTITNNSAPYFGFGAGVGSFGTSSTTRTEVGSSIIAGNKVNVTMPGNTPSDVDRIGGSFQDSFVSLGYNLIGTGITAGFSGATNDQFGVVDPGLEELADNGGPSRTHALKEDSPAVNRGNPSAVGGANGVPEFDQRGEARVKNGRIDVGAFESNFSSALAGDYNGDGVVNGRDFLAWQRGQSTTPGSSGDLADWQANYGNGGLATVVTTDEVSAPLVAVAVSGDSQTAAASQSITTAEPGSASSSSPVVVGWVPSMQQASQRAAAEDESQEAFLDAAYLALTDGLDATITAFDSDFGDIATCRPIGEDLDAAAEDAVFELIGAGEF